MRLVRRAGRVVGVLHRTAGSRPPDARRISLADRPPDRARRPAAARARAHALVGLQRVQPDSVLQPGDARRARRRRLVGLSNGRRTKPPAGGRFHGALRQPASGSGPIRKSPTSAPASSTACCAAPPRRGRNRSIERLPRRSAAVPRGSHWSFHNPGRNAGARPLRFSSPSDTRVANRKNEVGVTYEGDVSILLLSKPGEAATSSRWSQPRPTWPRRQRTWLDRCR